MKDIGVQLRTARESKGLTVNEVSVATKINPKVLSALENGDLSKLPPKSFLRGFVRTYAVYLKLDTEEILKRFSEELGTTVYTSTGLQKMPAQDQPVEEVKNDPSTPVETQKQKFEAIVASMAPRKIELPVPPFKPGPKLYIGIGIAVLVLVVFLLKGVVEKYERERTVEPFPIADVNESKAVEPVAEVTTIPAQGASVVNTAAPAVVNTPPAASASPTTQIPSVAQPATPSTKPETPAPAAAPVAKPKPAQQTVIVEALDKVSLAIRVDNGSTQRVTLSPDQVHSISGQTVVFVDVSDGGAVNIIHNGKEKGVPGDLGKPIKIKFP